MCARWQVARSVVPSGFRSQGALSRATTSTIPANDETTSAARAAGRRLGVDLFVNARTDVYLRGLVPAGARVAETLRRAKIYRDAGASGIFVPLPIEEDVLSRLAAGITLPLNAMGRPGMPSGPRLAQLGVRRLSSATGPFTAAYGAMLGATKAFLVDGDPTGYAAAGAGLPNLNTRFG